MVLQFSSILILSITAAGHGPQGPESPAERLGAMRALADQLTVETASPGAQRKLERVAEPVYRFDDPARRFADGTVWAWGRSGRPAALLTLAKGRPPSGNVRWVGELTSLTDSPIVAICPGGTRWQPSTPGVDMRKLPNAPLPGDDATKRLRQMKELVRQIKAYEYFTPPNHPARERYELRVLPQPVHRYTDTSSGLIDGALFMISYGLNPELVLLLEARRDGSTGPAWHVGFARIAIAEVHVEFESKEIWSHPGGHSNGPHDTYWIFVKAIEDE